MKIFKSNIFTKTKLVIYSICAGAFLSIVIRLFTDNNAIIFGISTFAALFWLFSSFTSNNITIRLDNETMQVFCLNKLKRKYYLKSVVFDSYIKTQFESIGSDSDCNLFITNQITNKRETLDCSMLGLNTYFKLLEALGLNSPPQPVQELIPASDDTNLKSHK